jgi:hypothetical protein
MARHFWPIEGNGRDVAVGLTAGTLLLAIGGLLLAFFAGQGIDPSSAMVGVV